MIIPSTSLHAHTLSGGRSKEQANHINNHGDTPMMNNIRGRRRHQRCRWWRWREVDGRKWQTVWIISISVSSTIIAVFLQPFSYLRQELHTEALLVFFFARCILQLDEYYYLFSNWSRSIMSIESHKKKLTFALWNWLVSNFVCAVGSIYFSELPSGDDTQWKKAECIFFPGFYTTSKDNRFFLPCGEVQKKEETQAYFFTGKTDNHGEWYIHT